MSRRILILTESDDFHAIGVAEALERKGAEVSLWATSDFPTRTDETVHYLPGRAPELRMAALAFDHSEFDTVWRRRPSFVLDKEVLHAADRAFAESECGVFRRSLLRLLAPDAFWVNPPEGAALAGSKLLQHHVACGIGLKTPETLFTNSPTEIRGFLARRQSVVYKPFIVTGWETRTHTYSPYTALVTENVLAADEVLRQTPGIYQELVPKAYELRVTVMGRHAFAAKVLSQDTVNGKLDWRRSYGELRFEPTVLHEEVESQCFTLLDELGLVFGCFDFVVTPSGDHVFLEVNEMGQFLFLERYCGLPLLDAFSEFLLQGRVDFEWNADEVQIRYTDSQFAAAVESRYAEFMEAHVRRPAALVQEEADG